MGQKISHSDVPVSVYYTTYYMVVLVVIELVTS